MLPAYLLEKGLDAAIRALVKAAKNLLSESGSAFLTTSEELEISIIQHQTLIKNWSREISFTDLKQAKSTTDVFIDLSLYLYPRRVRVHQDESIQSFPLK